VFESGVGASGIDGSTIVGSAVAGKVVSGHLRRDSDRVMASESLNSVMGEELQLKIAENARLHAALDGVDKRYEDRMGSLQSRIKELESAASKQAQAERADDTRLKELIHGLKADNAELTATVKTCERELADKNDRITVLQVQLESTTSNPSGNEQRTRSIGSNHSNHNYVSQNESRREMSCVTALSASVNSQQLMTNSSIASRICSQPPPLTSTEARIQTVELLSQFGENVQEIVAALSDLHTYWEHRLKDTHRESQTHQPILFECGV
jgi:hypothetical protein